jgi:FixJ family two-component response regulator
MLNWMASSGLKPLPKDGAMLPTVFVIDDDKDLRGALISLFESVGFQARAFESIEEFEKQKSWDAPSCLVLDVRLPGKSGLDLQTELGRADDSIPIVFISGHADVQTSARAMKAGALDFLVKPFREQELLDAVWYGIERDQQRHKRHKLQVELRRRFDTLTRRERQVFGLLASGLMNKQIAYDMQISIITVKLHRGNVMRKMQAGSLAELVRMSDALGRPSSTP